jgi:hypothetical protein
VLTIDPQNQKVLAILDRLNRRARLKTGALAVLGVSVVAVCAYFVHEKQKPPPGGVPQVDVAAVQPMASSTTIAHDDPPPAPRPDEPVVAPGSAVATVAHDADVEPAIDAAPAVEASAVTVRVLRGSEYSLDGGATWQKVDRQAFPVSVSDHAVDVLVRQPMTSMTTVHVEPGAKVVNASQQFRPASISLRCALAGVTADVNGRSVRLDRSETIPFEHNATSSQQSLTVRFIDARGNTDVQAITVTAGQDQDVTCALH